jgi:hypothetical protein
VAKTRRCNAWRGRGRGGIGAKLRVEDVEAVEVVLSGTFPKWESDQPELDNLLCQLNLPFRAPCLLSPSTLPLDPIEVLVGAMVSLSGN